MDQFIGPPASSLNMKSKSKIITDFFGKKRGRKRKVFSKLPKNKSLYGSSRKTKSIILQDGGDVDTPIIVKVRKNVDGEWSCIIEDIVIDLAKCFYNFGGVLFKAQSVVSAKDIAIHRTVH